MATAVSAVAAAKVNLRPVNKSALRRYQQFWFALARLDMAMSSVDRLVSQTRDDGRKHSYRVPSPEELARLQKKVERSISVMIAESKKWEAELVSREWR